MKRLFLFMWRMSRSDLRLLWFALKHKERPKWLVPAAVLLTLYAFSPLNFAIPIIGIVDDMVLVPMALHFVLGFLPASVLHAFSNLDAFVADERLRPEMRQ